MPFNCVGKCDGRGRALGLKEAIERFGRVNHLPIKTAFPGTVGLPHAGKTENFTVKVILENGTTKNVTVTVTGLSSNDPSHMPWSVTQEIV